MVSITESDSLTDLFIPEISEKNKEKIRRFQNLKTINGFAIADGMLLKSTSDRFLSLEEIYEKYNNYTARFHFKYYIIPTFGPNCSLEKRLKLFVRYDDVEIKYSGDVTKYKITPQGERQLKTCILDNEVSELLQN